jgi:hypothetical protein
LIINMSNLSKAWTEFIPFYLCLTIYEVHPTYPLVGLTYLFEVLYFELNTTTLNSDPYG